VALLRNEWLASQPICFTLGKGTPVTQWTGGKVGPKASLAFWRRKIILPLLGIRPISQALQPVARLLYSLSQNISYLQNFKIKKENVLAFWATKVYKVFKVVDTHRLLFSRELIQNNR